MMDEIDMNRAIAEIVQSVCSSVLGIDAVQTSARAGGAPVSDVLVGSVRIAGAWSGEVQLRSDAGFARRAAAIIFDAPDGGSDEENRDALGELTNMVAGNLKALLPAPSRLSLPAVAGDGEQSVNAPGGRSIGEGHFSAEEHHLAVTLTERTE
jgi:chemotaxis protein CheX